MAFSFGRGQFQFQFLLEVGFQFSPESPQNSFAFSFFFPFDRKVIEQLGFCFSFFEGLPKCTLPLQGVKGAIKARLEHA